MAASTTARPACDAIRHLDTEDVRITEFRMAPGTATGWHRHEFDYTIVPVRPGTVTVVTADGAETPAAMDPLAPYQRPAGVEHDVQNRSDGLIVFLEVERKV